MVLQADGEALVMLRRSFGTIHTGHLSENFQGKYFDDWDTPRDDLISAYFYWLKANVVGRFVEGGYHAGAFSLEEGTETQRKHIQFYVEHTRKRPSTLAKDFQYLHTDAVFDRVRDAKGSWDYCSQSGSHSGKEGVIDTFVFGTPKLHGDTHKADLKLMVSLILDGLTPIELLKEYPYAYCVHRRRIWDLFRDLKYGVDEDSFDAWKRRD